MEPATTPHAASPSHPDRLTVILRWAVGTLLAAVALAALWAGFAYLISPAAIRQPTRAHYHFRMQVINAGTPVNFAKGAFQTPFDADMCNAELTREPMHFHDGLDQFGHVHWSGMTGGLLLKNYGWNFITGADNTLGYRFDKLPQLMRVPIHGQALPKPPTGAHYYIYTGTAASYQERSWDDFLRQDLAKFFAGSPVTTNTPSLLGRLIPEASAHAGHDHGTPAASTTTATTSTQTERAQLNNVIGNVVIFAQTTRPTTDQIKDRFNHLVPLPESSCAG